MLLAQFSEQKHGMGITWFSAAYFVSQSCKWKYFWQPWVKKNDHDNNKYNDNENDQSKCYNNGTLKINSW